MHSGSYAEQEIIKPAPWHGLVAWDMLFNSMSTGLFMVAALCELVSPEVFTAVAKLAYPVALVLLLADLVLLVLDLGDPWRFHHMLRIFKPSSPMSLGVWSLTAFSLALTLIVLLGFFADGAALELFRKVLIVLGLAPALSSAVYKGVLLSTSAQPGWQDSRWLGGYLTSGAVVLGCAEMIVLALISGHFQASVALRPALAVLLVLHALPLIWIMLELRPAMINAFGPSSRLNAVAFIGFGSWVLPLILTAAGSAAFLLLAASLLILLGNLGARFMLVYLPHLAVQQKSQKHGAAAQKQLEQ